MDFAALLAHERKAAREARAAPATMARTSAPPLREIAIPGLEKGALLYCDDFVSASEEASLLAAAAAAGAGR